MFDELKRRRQVDMIEVAQLANVKGFLPGTRG